MDSRSGIAVLHSGNSGMAVFPEEIMDELVLVVLVVAVVVMVTWWSVMNGG